MLQLKQLEHLHEEDFLDTFASVATKPKATPVEEANEDVTEDSATKDLSQLSRKEQLALFKQSSPEFEGIVLDFQAKMAEASTILTPVLSLADEGTIPAGPVVEFLRAKLELVLNYCVNILCYLMFKSKGVNLRLHPVTGRLVQYRQMLDSLQETEAAVMPFIL